MNWRRFLKNVHAPSSCDDQSWLTLIAERSPNFVGYVGTDRRHIYANARYAEWFGLTPESIIGKTLKEIATHPEAYVTIEPYETRALAGEPGMIEVKIPHPLGEPAVVTFKCEFVPHFDRDGKVTGVVSISQDITEYERSAAAIRTTEQRFRTLTNTIPQLMWTASNDGQVTFVNERCLKYSGAASVEDYRLGWAERIHPEDRPEVYQAWLAAINSGRQFKKEYRIRNQAGEYHWFLGHAVPIVDSTGKIEYWIGTATDVEEERQRANELRQAKILAEDASRAKSAFLANMSHEIRTPLGAILGFSDLLKNDLSLKERTLFAQVIERNGKTLTRIIDDLLDLARVEAGHLVVDKVSFCVRELIADVATLFQDRADEKGITLTAVFDESVPEEIESDPVRLRQILINLIGNAVKFTDIGGVEVEVTSVVQPNGLLKMSFFVKDTGCGLTESQGVQMFQPFSQADPSSTRRHGDAGLGLALSRRLAEGLGGNVELLPNENHQGCVFVASVVTKSPLPTGIKAKRDKSAVDLCPESLEGIKVLVTDDSLDNLELMKEILISKRAWVDVSTNGSEAVQLVSRNAYDLVILDIQMPSMDGYQTIDAFRKAGFKNPVVAFTAHAMAEERRRSEAAGFAYHLTKPLNFSELFSVVERYGRAAH